MVCKGYLYFPRRKTTGNIAALVFVGSLLCRYALLASQAFLATEPAVEPTKNSIEDGSIAVGETGLFSQLPHQFLTSILKVFPAEERIPRRKIDNTCKRKGYQCPSMDLFCKHVQSPNISWAPYQDKVKVKQMITEWTHGRIQVAREYLTVRNPDEITGDVIERMPFVYIFKATHGTGGVVIVNKNSIYCLKEPCVNNSEKSVAIPRDSLVEHLRKTCALWLQHEVRYKIQRSYFHIEKGCMFEERLASAQDALYPEMQVFVVGGRPLITRFDYEFSLTRAANGTQVRQKSPAADHVTYFTTNVEHPRVIPGFQLAYDCSVTHPKTQITKQCKSEAEQVRFPLHKDTMRYLMDFAAQAARETGSGLLRVDVYIKDPSHLIFGELTFQPSACRNSVTPAIFDAVLGSAIINKGISTDDLADLAAYIVCDNPDSPYLRADACKDKTQKKLKNMRYNDIARVHKLRRPTERERMGPRFTQSNYFEVIAEICPPRRDEIGRVLPQHEVDGLFTEMRRTAIRMGVLRENARLNSGGIKFAHQVRIGNWGREVVTLEPIPEGNLVWESNDNNCAYFHNRTSMELFLSALSPALGCDAVHYAFQWLDGCVASCNGQCCDDQAETHGAPYMIIALDATSFVNHGNSSEANSHSTRDTVYANSVAKIDLPVGVSIRENYNLYDYKLVWWLDLIFDLLAARRTITSRHPGVAAPTLHTLLEYVTV